MAKVKIPTTCAIHLDKNAIELCDVCRRPLCRECRRLDLATGEVFCSAACRDASRSRPMTGKSHPPSSTTSRPIRTGWKLWWRNLRRLTLYLSPIAIVMGLLIGPQLIEDQSLVSQAPSEIGAVDLAPAEANAPNLPVLEPIFSPIQILSLALLFIFACALSGVILSDSYSGNETASPYLKALLRLVPWLTTWILMLVLITIGFLLLIVPGIILGLRLFWADEFALIHDCGPVEALRESWKLTENQTGSIFVFQFLLGLAEYLVFIPAFLLILASGVGLAMLAGMTGFPLEFLIGPIWALIIFLVYGSIHAAEVVYFHNLREAV